MEDIQSYFCPHGSNLCISESSESPRLMKIEVNVASNCIWNQNQNQNSAIDSEWARLL
jgi:hypothetical protein